MGNGTAGRETEAFIRALPGWSIPVVMVSESGASVYSASEAARAEFPDLDLTYRGAVSIGRRLADPLAELVKIDPKSIGVGQYQHDVNQSELKRCLDDVVVSCGQRAAPHLRFRPRPHARPQYRGSPPRKRPLPDPPGSSQGAPPRPQGL